MSNTNKDHSINKLKKKQYFIALVPDESIQKEVTFIKEAIAERFSSCAALKSPPHITLFPPFFFEEMREREIILEMTNVATQVAPFTFELRDFKAFSPRVIYIHAVVTKHLARLQQTVEERLEGSLHLRTKRPRRPFKPHMTVAFRDLTKENFHRAWEEFRTREFSRTFSAEGLTLLKHNGKRWEIVHKADFGGSPIVKP